MEGMVNVEVDIEMAVNKETLTRVLIKSRTRASALASAFHGSNPRSRDSGDSLFYNIYPVLFLSTLLEDNKHMFEEIN